MLPTEEAPCDMVELQLSLPWWAIPLFFRGSIADLIFCSRISGIDWLYIPLAGMLPSSFPAWLHMPGCCVCFLWESIKSEMSLLQSQEIPSGLRAHLIWISPYKISISPLFTFLIVWGLLYVVADLWVNTQMSIFGGPRGLICPKTNTNATRMSQTSLTWFSGCPPIDFSWLWFVSKYQTFPWWKRPNF